MIVNKNKVGHNFNACNMIFWKIQYLKYHMEDNCVLQQPAKKQSLESTRYKLCNRFHSKEDKYLCNKYVRILSLCKTKTSAMRRRIFWAKFNTHKIPWKCHQSVEEVPLKCHGSAMEVSTATAADLPLLTLPLSTAGWYKILCFNNLKKEPKG